jgi:quercetin dioxygenase-like cupin family protein
MRPYTNIKTSKNTIIREFNENIDPTELLWHRDLESRKITILEGNGWYFQKDNELPFEMKKGDTIFIPELSWHRIIKGNTTLTIKIQE